MEEDKLAIHTISNAAYSIYIDLHRARGENEATLHIKTGLLYLAFDYTRGVVSKDFCERVGLSGSLFDALTEMFLKNPALTPATAKVEGLDNLIERSSGVEADLRKLRTPGNYLKHADRDANSLINVEEFETEEILLRAIISSLRLNSPFTREKDFFCAAMFALGILDKPLYDSPSFAFLLERSRDQIMASGRLELCNQV